MTNFINTVDSALRNAIQATHEANDRLIECQSLYAYSCSKTDELKALGEERNLTNTLQEHSVTMCDAIDKGDLELAERSGMILIETKERFAEYNTKNKALWAERNVNRDSVKKAEDNLEEAKRSLAMAINGDRMLPFAPKDWM